MLVELVYIALGLAAAWAIGALAEWAYPIGRDSIRIVTAAAMGVVIVLGVRPLVAAWRGRSPHG
ncbi:hypothetical protein [Sphingomonas baiyangensis]|uniref:hypothetical protein n=1 Tax=Sphingomonas baiyangensis TaxID=2572576 RepID=UPI0010AE7CF4|nr:hypothetical protein [Sphingomonas baiyangensis]